LSASPILALALAAGLIATLAHFKKAPLKKSPEMADLASKADARMQVVYRCHIGDSYDQVKSRLEGASKIELYRSGVKQLKVLANWPVQNRRFVGRFDDQRLVWGTEQVSVTDDASRARGTRICLINAANPIVPMAMTTLERSAKSADTAFDDPKASLDGGE
jgi:hypothetical protein